MRLAEIWRYPVKSMAGERLSEAEVDAEGVVGDRTVLVLGARGRVLTARNHPALLALRATLGAGGEPMVDGRPWNDSTVAAAVREAAGPEASLRRWTGPERFDVLPLLVATDGALLAFGEDHRRLRPNLVIEGVDGLAEREWPGRALRIGRALISVASLRRRCVMTTYDPDTQAQDPGVLRRIVRDFDGRLALDCAVVEPGRIAVGDPVELV